MKTKTITPEMLIAGVLKQHPQAMKSFPEMKLGCVGRSMNRFCMIKEVCHNYDLDVESLSTNR
jgi:hypothetical protein